MEVVEKQFMTILPPAPGLCPECAVKHEPDQPHNAQSFYYQTKFKMEHKREVTWVDAMKHCSKEMKKAWMAQLKKLGIDVKGGQINPKR